MLKYQKNSMIQQSVVTECELEMFHLSECIVIIEQRGVLEMNCGKRGMSFISDAVYCECRS